MSAKNSSPPIFQNCSLCSSSRRNGRGISTKDEEDERASSHTPQPRKWFQVCAKIQLTDTKLDRPTDVYIAQDIERDASLSNVARLCPTSGLLKEQIARLERDGNTWLEPMRWWINEAENLAKIKMPLSPRQKNPPFKNLRLEPETPKPKGLWHGASTLRGGSHRGKIRCFRFCISLSAEGETRTHMRVFRLSQDFKSCASTIPPPRQVLLSYTLIFREARARIGHRR